MKRVVIVHGFENNSKGNWFDWLRKELIKKGYQVTAPDFPNSNKPRLSLWLKTLKQAAGRPDENLILVGHSLGTATILHYLEKINKKLRGVILVSALYKQAKIKTKKGQKYVNKFLKTEWNWKRIKKFGGNMFLIHADNDPYIELKQPKEIANKTGAKLIIKKNQGHFNLSTNPKYKRFPYLLKLFDKIGI